MATQASRPLSEKADPQLALPPSFASPQDPQWGGEHCQGYNKRHIDWRAEFSGLEHDLLAIMSSSLPRIRLLCGGTEVLA
jgi:hypothetical protein